MLQRTILWCPHMWTRAKLVPVSGATRGSNRSSTEQVWILLYTCTKWWTWWSYTWWDLPHATGLCQCQWSGSWFYQHHLLLFLHRCWVLISKLLLFNLETRPGRRNSMIDRGMRHPLGQLRVWTFELEISLIGLIHETAQGRNPRRETGIGLLLCHLPNPTDLWDPRGGLRKYRQNLGVSYACYTLFRNVFFTFVGIFSTFRDGSGRREGLLDWDINRWETRSCGLGYRMFSVLSNHPCLPYCTGWFQHWPAEDYTIM